MITHGIFTDLQILSRIVQCLTIALQNGLNNELFLGGQAVDFHLLWTQLFRRLSQGTQNTLSSLTI